MIDRKCISVTPNGWIIIITNIIKLLLIINLLGAPNNQNDCHREPVQQRASGWVNGTVRHALPAFPHGPYMQNHDENKIFNNFHKVICSNKYLYFGLPNFNLKFALFSTSNLADRYNQTASYQLSWHPYSVISMNSSNTQGILVKYIHFYNFVFNLFLQIPIIW